MAVLNGEYRLAVIDGSGTHIYHFSRESLTHGCACSPRRTRLSANLVPDRVPKYIAHCAEPAHVLELFETRPEEGPRTIHVAYHPYSVSDQESSSTAQQSSAVAQLPGQTLVTFVQEDAAEAVLDLFFIHTERSVLLLCNEFEGGEMTGGPPRLKIVSFFPLDCRDDSRDGPC
jgi:hypothetical protein